MRHPLPQGERGRKETDPVAHATVSYTHLDVYKRQARRCAHRAHLRSQGPDRHHDQDRVAQHGLRHRAHLPAAVGVSRKPPQRGDRRGDHPVRPVLRRRDHGVARRVRQPPERGCHRLRPDRRRHGHHGRGHLPHARPCVLALGGGGAPTVAGRRRRLWSAGQAGHHLHGGGGREQIDPVRRRHHHRGVPAAVHIERRRGAHLRADGKDLRLRPGGRPARDLHDHARALRGHPARACPGDRDPGGALGPSHLRAGAATGDRQQDPGRRTGARPVGARRCDGALARSRIPPEARGGQSLGAGDLAVHHLARRRQRIRQSHARLDPELPGGRGGGVAAWPTG